MSATLEQPQIAARPQVRMGFATTAPLWLAVVLSRLVIVVAGAVTVLTSSRFVDWAQYDPTRSSAHLGALGNVLAASVDRWDSIHYQQIAQSGYQLKGNTSFFPLYPLLMRALAEISGSYVIAGTLISCACFAIALVLLHRLVCEEFDRRTAQVLTLLLAFTPLSFFFTAAYTESLFLAMSVGAFYAARRQRWWLAALLAGACAITRVPGLLVIVPVAYLWWQSDRRPRRALAWFALAPVPLLAFLVYLQLRGWGFLAPLANESTVYQRVMAGPFGTIVMALRAAITNPQQADGSSIPLGSLLAYNRELLVVLLICLATLLGAWRRLPRPYALYATLVLAVDLWSPIALTPLRSFDRYALVIFPLWICAALWLRDRRRLLLTVLGVCTVMLVYNVHQFALWGFIA